MHFAPRFTQQINAASVKVQTKLGEASISWQSKDGFSAEITIPSGLQGDFCIKTGKKILVEGENGEKTSYSAVDGKVIAVLPDGKSRIVVLG